MSTSKYLVAFLSAHGPDMHYVVTFFLAEVAAFVFHSTFLLAPAVLHILPIIQFLNFSSRLMSQALEA